MTGVILIAYFTGVLLWQYPLLYRWFSALRGRIYIRRNLRHLTDTAGLEKRSFADRHIHLLIEGSEAQKIFPSTTSFYMISCITAAGIAAVVAMTESVSMALACGLFTGMLPYLILKVRLYNRRVARSREGDLLVQELLNNYKICDFNMKEAVEATAESLEDAPNGRRLLLHLAKGLQTAATRNELESLLSVFRYAIDTAWGNVLASNIFFAHFYGVRVDQALEDLLAGIVRSRQVVEHGKRENNEARLILTYLVPVSFLLSVLCACHYFGFTLAKFMRYQFGTALGLKWFLIMAMLYVAGLLLNGFFSREKMDI